MPEMRRPSTAGDAVYYAVTGLSPRSEGETTQKRTADLVKRVGSTATAAALVGVAQRTIQKWLKGEQEAKNTARGANADALAAAQRAARIKDGRAALLRGAGRSAPAEGQTQPAGGLRLYGDVKVSEDIRARWINPGQKIPSERLDALLDLLVNDGAEAAGAELNNLLGLYVPGMTITNVEEIQY